MGSTSDAVVEFYRQLALLTRAGVPLPEGLSGLADGCGQRSLQRALREMNGTVQTGVNLSDAVRRHDRLFSKFEADLIAVGESSGTLPEVLHELGQIAAFQHRLSAHLREAVAYPVLTVVLAFGVLLALMSMVMPEWRVLFSEFYAAAIPAYSRAFFGVTDVVSHLRVACWSLYAVGILWLVWLFSEQSAAQRQFHRVVGHVPGTCGVVGDLESARLCGLWSVLLSRNTPFPQVLEASLGLVQSRRLRQALTSLRERAVAGQSLNELFSDVNGLPESLRLALAHSVEGALAEELSGVRDFYVDRAATASKRLAVLWQVSGLAVMSVVVGAVLVAMFLPLVQLYVFMAGSGF